jgi:hypothetical protein
MLRTKIISNNAIIFFEDYKESFNKKNLKRLKGNGIFWKLSQNQPVLLTLEKRVGIRKYQIYKGQLVLYQNCIYSVEPSYSEEKIKLLVLEKADAETKKFERLRRKFISTVTPDKNSKIKQTEKI